MSLLTSTKTTEEQLKFLNKMEKHYHRRGGSFYLSRQKKGSVSISSKIPSQAIIKIEELINDFMKQMRSVIKQFQNMDYYTLLQILRKHELFSDVTKELQLDLLHRLTQVSEQFSKQQQKIKSLKKGLKQAEQKGVTKIEKFEEKQKIAYNPAKSMPLNIYYHARVLPEEDFTKFYNRITLSNAITLKKVHENPRLKSKVGLEEKIHQIIQCSSANMSEEQVAELLQLAKLLASSQECHRPCCQSLSEQPDSRENKARTLITANQSRVSQNIYKNDKSEEYFKRYYRAGSFKINDITSVTRTRREQMQKLEDDYRKNLKKRSKKASVRYSPTMGKDES